MLQSGAAVALGSEYQSNAIAIRELGPPFGYCSRLLIFEMDSLQKDGERLGKYCKFLVLVGWRKLMNELRSELIIRGELEVTCMVIT